MNKNICWFDLETTGLSIPHDSIIEIGAIKTDSDLNEIERFCTYVKPEGDFTIDPTAFAKHGISKEDLMDKPTFKEIADKLLDFIGDCDLGGYNIAKFDLAMIVEEFLRAGRSLEYKNRNIIDGYAIYNKWEQRTLEATYKRFFGEDLKDAHSADADIIATIKVYEKQKELYNLPSPDEIDATCFADKKNKLDLAQKFIVDEHKNIYFNFGKYKGQLIDDVYKRDAWYFDWMINSNDFPYESRVYAKKLKKYIEQKNI